MKDILKTIGTYILGGVLGIILVVTFFKISDTPIVHKIVNIYQVKVNNASPELLNRVKKIETARVNVYFSMVNMRDAAKEQDAEKHSKAARELELQLDILHTAIDEPIPQNLDYFPDSVKQAVYSHQENALLMRKLGKDVLKIREEAVYWETYYKDLKEKLDNSYEMALKGETLRNFIFSNVKYK